MIKKIGGNTDSIFNNLFLYLDQLRNFLKMADFLVVVLTMEWTNYKDDVPHFFLLFNNTKHAITMQNIFQVLFSKDSILKIDLFEFHENKQYYYFKS